MTAIPITPESFGHTESADALDLRERVKQALFAAPSISVGTRVQDLVDAVMATAAQAKAANWDGDGALPVLESTAGYAREFATLLPRELPAPEVSADKDGDLSFEWDFGARRVFAVSVRYDGVLHYAGLFGHNKSNGSEVLLNGLPPAILANIIRVAARA